MAVVVEIEGSEEAGLPGAQIERRREQAEVGDIDVPIAVDVAIEAEEALRLDEDEIATGRTVSIAVERLAVDANLARQRCERVSAIAQRAEFGFAAGEIVERNDGASANRRSCRGVSNRPAARARESKGVR